MYKKVSYWEQNTFLKEIDLVVVGSGIVGLSAALSYKERFPKRKIVVLEKGSLPTGASTKNAGFACFGSITELVADLEQHGEEMVVDLVKKRWDGLHKLRERVGDRTMNYREYGGFELLLEDENTEKMEAYIPFFNDRLKSVIGVQDVFSKMDNAWRKMGFGKKGLLIKNKAEGQIHPGKMMVKLLKLARRKAITILNGCEVQEVSEGRETVHISSNVFDCEARQVLFATNGFTTRLFPDLLIQPARNQVILTEVIPNLKLKGCFHFEEGYYYFRNIGQRILLGGARNIAKKEETTDEFGSTKVIQQQLSAFLHEIILPDQAVAIEHSWSGILGIGPTKSPIVQKLSGRMAVAVRLGGMGVAIGSLVGEAGALLFE